MSDSCDKNQAYKGKKKMVVSIVKEGKWLDSKYNNNIIYGISKFHQTLFQAFYLIWFDNTLLITPTLRKRMLRLRTQDSNPESLASICIFDVLCIEGKNSC